MVVQSRQGFDQGIDKTLTKPCGRPLLQDPYINKMSNDRKMCIQTWANVYIGRENFHNKTFM